MASAGPDGNTGNGNGTCRYADQFQYFSNYEMYLYGASKPQL